MPAKMQTIADKTAACSVQQIDTASQLIPQHIHNTCLLVLQPSLIVSSWICWKIMASNSSFVQVHCMLLYQGTPPGLGLLHNIANNMPVVQGLNSFPLTGTLVTLMSSQLHILWPPRE